jgi:hypothetical protein
MNSPRAVCFLLLAIFVTLAGCNTPTRSGNVTATVIDFRPTDASIWETRATLSLRYTNTGISALHLEGAAHKLYLNGSYIGQAVTHEGLELPALGTATQAITLFLENLALVQKLEGLQTATAIEYRLESILYVNTTEGRSSAIKTSAAGKLDLSELRRGMGRE